MNKADANKSVMSTNNLGPIAYKYASAKKDSLSDSYVENAEKEDQHDLP